MWVLKELKIFNRLIQLVVLMIILISGDHFRHKPFARHKMSLVYPLSNPAPSGKGIVLLIKWDS